MRTGSMALVAVLAAGAAWLLWPGSTPTGGGLTSGGMPAAPAPAASASASGGAAAPSARSRPAPAEAGRPGARLEPETDTTAVLDDLESFRERLAELLRTAPVLGEIERRRRVAAIDADLDELTARRVVLPAQAVLLRVELLRATAPDEATFLREAQALVAEARARGAARRSEAARELLAASAEYRRREAEVVAEVMQEAQPLDDGARQRILRKRLQDLRVEIYDR